jgi:hypothetical protein
MLTFQVSRGQRSRWILQKLDPRIWDLLLGKESGNERDFVLPERFHDYLKWPPEQLRIVSSTDIDWRPSLNAAKKLQHCHQNEAMKYECNQNNCFMGKYCKNRFIGNLLQGMKSSLTTSRCAFEDYQAEDASRSIRFPPLQQTAASCIDTTSPNMDTAEVLENNGDNQPCETDTPQSPRDHRHTASRSQSIRGH